MQAGFELGVHSQPVLNMATQVLAQLLTPAMFSTAYPLDAVKLAPNGATFHACGSDVDAPALVHASVRALAAHARAVMATGATSLEALLAVAVPVERHALMDASLSVQVCLFVLLL